MVPLLGPFAPYLTAEMWQELGQTTSIENSSWPDFDPELARDDEVEVVPQVNGKLRSKLNVPRGTGRGELERQAREDPKVTVHLDGKAIRKVIVVPDKLVNIVVG
jgi:leucyl-tRNA synthetase